MWFCATAVLLLRYLLKYDTLGTNLWEAINNAGFLKQTAFQQKVYYAIINVLILW